jgi:energy-coupling factor transport system permease protein
MAVDFFMPGRSFLHRYDPRAKLILLAMLTAAFFLPSRPVAHLVLAAALAAVVWGGFGLRELLRPLRALGPVLLLILLLTPPFHTGGEVYLRIRGLPLVTAEGLLVTVTMLERFLGLTLAFIAAFRSTELDELTLALRWFGLPYTSALVVIIAFRYIPTLGQTYRSAVEAHKLRAPSPDHVSSRRGRLKGQLPILTSVLIQAVRGMPMLAMALECRGFGSAGKRSTFGELKGGWALVRDAAAAALVSAAVLLPLTLAPLM